jgi:AGZA family xanthine/uracil permease-like MFS transporter
MPLSRELSSRITRVFDLDARGSSVATEARGAVATFLTMAYILFANPSILAAAGVPFESAVAATAASAAVCSILMGVVANAPIALAAGMGLNAVIAFHVAPAAGSWQTAMGLVVIDGLLVVALVVLGLREAVMHAIPRDLRRAIGVGIGLFIAFIGAVNAKLVIVPAETVAALARGGVGGFPPVTHGSLRAPEAAIAIVGIIVISYLLVRRVRGAIVLGILAGAVLALVLGVASPPSGRWIALPSFDTVGQADVVDALRLSVLPLVVPLVLVDFFDTIGTVTAVSEEARQMDEHGGVPRLRRILLVDGVSASLGGLAGASSVTSYVESAAGVAEGARTGLHTVLVGLLFALAMFAAPVAGIVPAAATAPALIVVGFLMVQQIGRIDFRKVDSALPAFVLLTTIPFTYSISHGIGFGFITYVAIKLLSGHVREVHPLLYGSAALFAAYFILS